MQPRLELRREDQIHEYERQHERDQEVLRGPAQLARSAGEPRAIPWPHVERFCGPGHRIHRWCLRNARLEACEDGDLSLTVEAIDRAWCGPRRDGGYILQRHAADAVRRYGQLPDAAGRVARGLERAHVDFVLLPAFIVGRDFVPSDEEPERLCGIGDLNAEIRCLQSIEMHGELGLAGVERSVDVDDAGLITRGGRHSRGILLQLAEI